MTKKSNKKVQGSIFWTRDKSTKITVIRNPKAPDEMKVRKGNSIETHDLAIPKDNFVKNMRARVESSRTASICSVCNSSISIHQNEVSCKGGK